jgi:molybdopterin-guanine dinucleotide biosynthesis protein A
MNTWNQTQAKVKRPQKDLGLDWKELQKEPMALDPQRPWTGVILMGGYSKRFGTSKAHYEWQGRALAQTVIQAVRNSFAEIILVARKDQECPEWGQDQIIYDDSNLPAGPLRGIYAALEMASHPDVMVFSCDSPCPQVSVIEALKQISKGGLLCFENEGFEQPFPGVWPRSEKYKIRSVLHGQSTSSPRYYMRKRGMIALPMSLAKYYDPSLLSFCGANQREELLKIEQRLVESQKSKQSLFNEANHD